MFRLTIRELLLVTACVALGISWWHSNQVSKAAADDARELAQFAGRPFGLCGLQAGRLTTLLEKYGATHSLVTPRIHIVEEEEEKLGIDFEE